MPKWILSVLLCCALIGASAAEEPLLFAVNEGSTYRVSMAETTARYEGVAEDLSKLLHRHVVVVAVGDYAELVAGLAEKRFTLAYVHPAHVSIRAVRSGGYHMLALTKGYLDYRSTFFVPVSSPLHTLADLKGKKISAPDQDSVTSWMVRATLRDAVGASSPNDVIYTRYQDAIPFMVEQGLADVGSSSAAGVIKAWVDKGGRVIGTSKAVPIKHLLAVSSLPPEQFKAVQDYFLNLEGTEAGRGRLERIQVAGFVGFDEKLLVGIGKWLGV